ncbi:Protein CBR-SRH-44 [Caenorhabditis briggsae]|uniref:Protein CBR-SRH-44 n=1 Tax=Caenorhabditis briggsae TaxID=6238 RepID=A8WTB9_CAEBR|nr:Protein CBR-SRH-44 [Caenorhabditis briggsae]CAP23730.2 Protein CBR-SRH-44 [Caenorhabditis briggsae]
MNTSCSTVFTYWDSWQFQATFSHLLILITLPINLFGGYCIIKKTPRNRKSARWYLLHLHAWTIISDVLIGGLVCPYMFFPVLVGISVGVFSWISVPVWIQVFCAQVGLGGLATAIVMLFENRHNTLVRGRFKIEAEWIRYTFYAINGIYALLFLLPVYFQIPDPEWAKPILLKVVCELSGFFSIFRNPFQILPCPHPSYFQNNVFVFSMEISAVTGTAGIFLLFFLAEVFILCIHSSYFLLSLKTHMSPATQKLQIKFFVDMIFQVSIPVAVIVLPMTYCFYSIVWQYYNQMLNNIAIICISLHGMGSTITLIWLNPSYRQFTISVITCFRYDPSFRRSSVMTVSPATITQQHSKKI